MAFSLKNQSTDLFKELMNLRSRIQELFGIQMVISCLGNILFIDFTFTSYYYLSSPFLNLLTKLIPTPGMANSSSSDADIIDSGVIKPAS